MDLFDKRVIGYESTKETLRQILDILRHRSYYEARGASVPHGLFMVSAPGLGKSLLATTFMEESGRNCTIFHKDSDEESFLDSLREAFLIARQSAPSVLLLEDINLYADSPTPYGPQWAALQSAIDDVVKDDDVFVIATANTTHCIPDSLLRPGRFDYTITLDPPKGKIAERIAAHYLKDKPLGDDVLVSDIVRAMGGSASCAALEAVMNVASINSCYRGSEKIDKADLIEAILQVVYKIKRDDDEKNPDIGQIALHEAAHVVVADVLKPDSVALVTLRKNGCRQGMTQYCCDGEISTETDLLNLAIKSLAGKAGVEMVYGTFDIGAGEDLQTAAGYVRQWIESFGGSGFSGIVWRQSGASETLLAQNEKTASAKLEELYRTAQDILRENHDFLMAVQKALLEQETLLGSDIAAIRDCFKSSSATTNNFITKFDEQLRVTRTACNT